MMKMTLAEIARVVKAQPLSETVGSQVATGVAFDSRRIEAGNVICPIAWRA